MTRAQEYEEMYGVRRELNNLRKKVAAYERKERLQTVNISTCNVHIYNYNVFRNHVQLLQRPIPINYPQ